MKRPFTALALGVVLQLTLPAHAESTTADDAADRDVIANRTDDVVPALAAPAARPGQTVRGMVAGTDEGGDRITVRVPNHDSEDFRVETFKVQDGLLFNAVRFGDQVEITVQSVDGARTIVALKKQ
ncbi:MAG: hypothetical protein JO141_03975 [Bradyrhizobium sp.]|nr:hypothetical protein [Bradyrhizobium sp.]